MANYCFTNYCIEGNKPSLSKNTRLMAKIEENKKPVNEQETRNLILRIQSGDAEAETRLVDLHKGFTASVARQYQGQGMLKEVKDIQLALYGTDDNDNYHGDEHIVFIEDEYPAVLLDEIYAKLKEESK